MNTLQSRLSSTTRFGTSPSRAQLSPLLRRSTLETLNRRTASAPDSRRKPLVVSTIATQLGSASPAVERWWDPHLVDRLQTPLTRFRD